MSRAAHRPATWDDIARLPEGDRIEVVDGELWTAPSPLPRHGFIEGAMSGFVGVPFQYDPKGPGGWWVVPEIDVELTPHDIVRPDLSGWRRERMPRFPSERPVRIVPDWVSEIVSPSPARMDRLVKPALYLRSGVPFFWLVDPEARILEAFEAKDGVGAVGVIETPPGVGDEGEEAGDEVQCLAASCTRNPEWFQESRRRMRSSSRRPDSGFLCSLETGENLRRPRGEADDASGGAGGLGARGALASRARSSSSGCASRPRTIDSESPK